MITICLLSFYAEDVQPVREHLINGMANNRDGSGWAIAVPREGRILTGRDLNQRAALEQFLLFRKAYPHGPALFHSRLATRGTVEPANCHPFQCGDDVATVVAHNGTLFAVPDGEDRSDTRLYAEVVFPQLHSRLDRPAVRDRISQFAGRSRLVFLTVSPRYRHRWYLFGESLGTWVNPDGTTARDLAAGVTAWHSNPDWRKTSVRYVHKAAPGGRLAPGRVWLDSATGAFCRNCQQEYSVDTLTRICRACRVCADCLVPAQQCACWEVVGAADTAGAAARGAAC